MLSKKQLWHLICVATGHDTQSITTSIACFQSLTLEKHALRKDTEKDYMEDRNLFVVACVPWHVGQVRREHGSRAGRGAGARAPARRRRLREGTGRGKGNDRIMAIGVRGSMPGHTAASSA